MEIVLITLGASRIYFDAEMGDALTEALDGFAGDPNVRVVIVTGGAPGYFNRSKPRLALARIVGIKIDVQARYSAISKFEDVAETAARSFAPLPTTYQTFCPVKCLQRRDSRLKE